MKRRQPVPYAALTRAAGEHADAVMNAMPRAGKYARVARARQREAWNVAFEAFKRGARWARLKSPPAAGKVVA